jgi:hypothetical protein
MIAVESGPQRVTAFRTLPVRSPVKFVPLSKIESPWIAHLRLILMLRVDLILIIPRSLRAAAKRDIDEAVARRNESSLPATYKAKKAPPDR